MARRPIGITQAELFAKSDRRVVADTVREQLRVIDAAIVTAHLAGFNHIEHELPINFNINSLNKMDSQTMIYSEILMAYKQPVEEGGKGFDETFIEFNTRPKLHVYWLNGINDEERRQRQEYITSSLIKPHDHAPARR